MDQMRDIRNRLASAKVHAAPAFMLPTADLEYLLGELEKRDAALDRILATIRAIDDQDGR